jgi:UDP-3-O-[3-hydroxymyristoyl] glucosamine N-acyltransferase
VTVLEADAAEVASWVDGRVLGDGAVRVRGVAPIEEAGPTELTFLAGRRNLPSLRASAAGVVLLRPEFQEAAAGPAARIVVAEPLAAFITVVQRFYPEPAPSPSVHPTVVVGRGATWGEGVELAPRAVLGRGVQLGDRVRIGTSCVVGDDVVIGDDTELVASVTVYPQTTIGARVLVHGGTVIGADGFGFVPSADGQHTKIPHIGRVVIEDDVELGANCTVDRGSLGDTVIGTGTKIDNLVHIAHNVRIGRGCLIAAQSGIAGSSVLEDGVVIGGQAGITDHCRIGTGAQVGAQGGVINSLDPGSRFSGTPARPVSEWLRGEAAQPRLAKIVRQLEALVRRYGDDD